MTATDERVQEMAAFVVAFPGFTPATYWSLTLQEQQALIAAFNRAHPR